MDQIIHADSHLTRRSENRPIIAAQLTDTIFSNQILFDGLI